MEDLKTRINAGFRLMRKRGLFARQNYWCCRSCASAAAVGDIKERQDKGRTITGCAYTTQQDYEIFKDGGHLSGVEDIRGLVTAIKYLQHGGKPDWKSVSEARLAYQARRHLHEDTSVAWLQHLLWERLEHRRVHYIGYSGVDQPDGTETDCTEVGKIVVACLKKAGVETEWDGSSATRIGIPLLQDADLTEARALAKKMEKAS